MTVAQPLRWVGTTRHSGKEVLPVAGAVLCVAFVILGAAAVMLSAYTYMRRQARDSSTTYPLTRAWTGCALHAPALLSFCH